MTVAAVRLWGRRIGAVSIEPGARAAVFQYTPEFARSRVEVSPLVMPLRREPYAFDRLPRDTFYGLPGLLSDSLPDRYGHALIDAWLARQGRTPDSFDAVERLCYTGARGMGALEYEPTLGPAVTESRRLAVDQLVELASDVLAQRGELGASFEEMDREEAMRDILRVGTSAGGARAKAVIAYHPETHEVRSGQLPADSGFEYWLLKFDGVESTSDRELDASSGYTAIEFAYAEMAKSAGIAMTECQLLEEGGRRHFMTKRFDRLEGGRKLHMQTLGAIAHYDFNEAGAYSYEQAMQVVRRLGMSTPAVEEQFRRMVFNVVARNQDDHVKNIAFLMDRRGEWTLAPAYDVTYSYNPYGRWTSSHQMSMNGKRDGFSRDDFRECARAVSLKRGRADTILDEVIAAVRRWPHFAESAHVTPEWRAPIAEAHRLDLG